MWLFDAHLDLALNAVDWNRDLRQPVEDIRAQERSLGMHANTAETAWLQVIAPQYVSMPDAVCEYPDPAAAAGQRRLRLRAALRSPRTSTGADPHGLGRTSDAAGQP